MDVTILYLRADSSFITQSIEKIGAAGIGVRYETM